MSEKKLAINNSSGHTGICWNKAKCRWEVDIFHRGKRMRIGRFKDINDAIQARESAELMYPKAPNKTREKKVAIDNVKVKFVRRTKSQEIRMLRLIRVLKVIRFLHKDNAYTLLYLLNRRIKQLK